jgi:hypothetical protein
MEQIMQQFPYISKGVKISRSVHHKGMFILSYVDGGFINVNSSAEQMIALHLPDIGQRFLEHTKFNFTGVSRYQPSKNPPKDKWQREKVAPNLN